MKYLFFLFIILSAVLTVPVCHAQDKETLLNVTQYGGCGEDYCKQHPAKCHNPVCDDGTTPFCEMIPPTCAFGEILAYQNNCYRCVNPFTCLPKSWCGGKDKVPCHNRNQICWYKTGNENYGRCVDQINDKPVCSAIGTRSEGWYWQQSGELIQWAQCESEMAACFLESGNKSQGWYLVGETPGSDSLITWDACTQ